MDTSPMSARLQRTPRQPSRKRSEAMGFSDILRWLQTKHMGDMASLPLMTVDDLKSHQVSMANIGLDGHEIIEEFDSLPTASRPGLPVLNPGGRGSIRRALDLTVTDRENVLIAKLEDDMYAYNHPRNPEKPCGRPGARWHKLCPLFSFPFTEEFIIKVGVSFKAGHYTSPPRTTLAEHFKNTDLSHSNTQHLSSSRSSRTPSAPSPEDLDQHPSRILSMSNYSIKPSIPMTQTQLHSSR